MKAVWICVPIAALCLTGCADAPRPVAHTVAPAVAGLVCDAGVPENPPNGTTVSTCKVDGVSAVVIRFPTIGAQTATEAQIRNAPHSGDDFYAEGFGWVAAMNGDRHVADVFAQVMGGQVIRY